MQEKIEITKDFLVESSFSEKALKEFDTHFPKGSATVPEFLKKCEELDLFNLAQSIISKLPQNPEPLVLDEYSGGNIFYNGDIYIKKGVECSGGIICRKLKVDGDIVIGERFWVYANVYADGIDLRSAGMLVGDGSSRRLKLQGKARAHGRFKTIDAELRGSSIVNGRIEALNIIKGEDARIDREFIFNKFFKLKGISDDSKN